MKSRKKKTAQTAVKNQFVRTAANVTTQIATQVVSIAAPYVKQIKEKNGKAYKLTKLQCSDKKETQKDESF